MKIIGLTGGIASGKSTVSASLRESGAIIIDADETSHQIIEPHRPAWEEIVERFGEEILNDDQTINREKLGAIVFNRPDALQDLNRITHPRVMERFKEDLKRIGSTQPDAIVVLDVPLLYETHMERICDEVWVIWVDHETQIKRLMGRNGYTREEAVLRIASQMSLDEKANRADHIIDNRGSIEETIRITGNFFNAILQQD